MKRLLLSLLYAFPLLAQAPVTITGVITDAGNNPATSGFVQFDITPKISSVHYFVPGIGTITQTVQCGINASGLIKSQANLLNPCTVWGNDVISPGNTQYKITLAPNGNITNIINSECITGVNYSLNNPVFCGIVQINPQQTIVRANPFQTNIIPVTTNVFNVGSSSLQFANGYFSNLFQNGVGVPTLVANNNWIGNNFFSILSGDLYITSNGLYQTLGACYAALVASSSATTCHVPAGYSETLSFNLVLSKANAGFAFHGPATITMGTNEVLMVNGTNGVSGGFIVGYSPSGTLPQTAHQVYAATDGVQFIYTGAGPAFIIGGSGTVATSGIRLENFAIDLRGAGGAALGMDLVDVNTDGSINGLFVIGAGGAVSQIGLQMDDGFVGGFTGNITVSNFHAFGTLTGMLFNGGTQEMTFLDTTIEQLAPGGIGVDFEGSGSCSANTFMGGVINPQTGTGVKFGGSCNLNHLEIGIQGTPTTVAFGASATKNFVRYLGTVTPVVTDASNGSNTFIWGTLPSGTAAMTTALIASGACGSTVTVAATGVLTTDTVTWSFNASPGGNPASLLVLGAWPTTNNVNFAYCNPTAGNQTPNAITLNWKVVR
jgi:hypothetical protein